MFESNNCLSIVGVIMVIKNIFFGKEYKCVSPKGCEVKFATCFLCSSSTIVLVL